MGDMEKTITERAVAEARVEACTVLADKLQEIQVQSRSLVADVESKLAHDRATKMQTTDGRDVGDLAEQLDALEISFRAVDGQASQPVLLKENSLTKQLQAEVRELRQKCEELSAQLPDF